MNSVSIVPTALFCAVLRIVGLYLVVDGALALVMSFSPGVGKQLAIANAFSFFGPVAIAGVRSTIVVSVIIPGLIFLFGGAKITSLVTGANIDNETYQAQASALYSLGLAIVGVWTVVSGLSYFALTCAWLVRQSGGIRSDGPSIWEGICWGFAYVAVGVAILLFFRALIRKVSL